MAPISYTLHGNKISDYITYTYYLINRMFAAIFGLSSSAKEAAGCVTC